MFNKQDLEQYKGKKIKIFLKSGYILTGYVKSIGEEKFRFIGKFNELSIIELSEIKSLMEINGSYHD